MCIHICISCVQYTYSVLVCWISTPAAPGSLIFICFNFMMSIKADVSHAAYRMGILEMTRQAVTWFITAYIFMASPSAKDGTMGNPK